MSAGSFIRGRYRASYGTVAAIHPIRIQPETAALVISGVANTAATEDLTSPISANVSRGRRSLGLHARMVSLVFTAAVPAGYKPDSPIRIPLLNPDIALVAVPGATGTYLTLPIQVVGFSAEVVR